MSCDVTFYKDTNISNTAGSGHKKEYKSPDSVPDLSQVQWPDKGIGGDSMNTDISWISLEINTSVMVYTQKNYGGAGTLIGPGGDYSMVTLGLDDAIQSFHIYYQVQAPSLQSCSPNIPALGALYPSGWNAKDSDGHPCAEFSSADSQYRAKQPKWTPLIDGSGTAVMNMDHIRGGEEDDHATLTVVFSPTGDMVSADFTWTLGGSWAIQLGSIVVVHIEGKVSDDAGAAVATGISALVDLLSDGALVELDPIIEVVVTRIVSAYVMSMFSNLNAMIMKDLEKKDDGRENFIAVANQNLNKLCASMSLYPALTLPNIGIGFDMTAFPTNMFSSLEWDGDHTGGYTLEGTHNFRTWKLDCSPYPLRTGIYMSTKIDMIVNNASDGHAIAMLGCSSNGAVMAAQAVLVYPGGDDTPYYPSPTFTGTDAISQLVQDLKNPQKQNQGDSWVVATADVIQKNMNAMAQSVRVGMTTLSSDQVMNVNGRLVSNNGKYMLTLETDGNLVLYSLSDGTAIWAIRGKGAVSLTLQTDGNLVMKDSNGNTQWNTETKDKGGTSLVMQDDQNLVIYTSAGNPVWATNTNI